MCVTESERHNIRACARRWEEILYWLSGSQKFRMRVQWRWFSFCFCSRPRHCEPSAPFLLLISYLCLQAAVTLGRHTLSTHTLPLRLERNPIGQFSVHPSHIHFRNHSCCKVLSNVIRASDVAILCDTPVSILSGLCQFSPSLTFHHQACHPRRE